MDANVPYMGSVTNVAKILDKIQGAGVPEVFNLDFLRDLGFSSSSDRPMTKMLKYFGFLDASGKPQQPYREFLNNKHSRAVLADRLRIAYDDLFLSDKAAHGKSTTDLKGWFKTKTGAGDASAEKMASTFKAFATYADFSAAAPAVAQQEDSHDSSSDDEIDTAVPFPKNGTRIPPFSSAGLGFTYRIEIHLPDTQNIETFRSIFRAIREELT